MAGFTAVPGVGKVKEKVGLGILALFLILTTAGPGRHLDASPGSPHWHFQPRLLVLVQGIGSNSGELLPYIHWCYRFKLVLDRG